MKFLLFLFSIQMSHFLVNGCTTGEVRLANGLTSNQGRVEICINGTWGTVCDDIWYVHNSEVVCRQLGYNTDGVTYIHNYGGGTGSIFLDDVVCSGHECNLLDCLHDPIRVHNCGHHEDVGVSCPSLQSRSTCTPFDSLPSPTASTTTSLANSFVEHYSSFFCNCPYQSSIAVTTLTITTTANAVGSTVPSVIDNCTTVETTAISLIDTCTASITVTHQAVTTLTVTSTATITRSIASGLIDTCIASFTVPIVTVTTTVEIQSVVDNSQVSMMCLSKLSYQSIITITVTSTVGASSVVDSCTMSLSGLSYQSIITVTVTSAATAAGSTAAITSAIVLPLLLLIIIVSLLSPLAFIYCYKRRKTLNKKPVCERKISTLKEIVDEDVDSEIVFNMSYNDQADSFRSASLQLPPVPEDQLSDGFYSEIKDCYL